MNLPKPHLLALLAFLSLGASHEAYADGAVPTAEEHLEELRFEEAQALAQSVLSKGKSDPQEVGRLYMVLGRVAASLGEDSEAVAMFHNALSIDATLRLPDGVSPKLSEPFATAQARLEGATPIAIEVQQLDAGLLVVRVDSDPANLVGGAQVVYKIKGKSKTQRGTGRSTIEIVVPESASAIEVTALDMQGNRLTAKQNLLSKKSAPSVEVSSTVTKEPSTPGPALYERWEIYGGAAGIALLGGLYLGKTADDAASEVSKLEDGTEFSVAKALEEKATSRALYANITFAGAGLLGAAAVWMYTRGDDEPEARAKTAIVVPTVSRDGLGIGASLRF